MEGENRNTENRNNRMIKKRGEERGKGRQDKNVKSYKSYRWRKLFFKKKKKQNKTKRKGEFLISVPVSGGILLTQQM